MSGIFLEELDLPAKLDLKPSIFTPITTTWIQCYCSTIIHGDLPHCGLERCERTAIAKLRSVFTTSSSLDSELQNIINNVPITLIKKIEQREDFLAIGFFLTEKAVHQLLNNSNTPIEFLLYIYAHSGPQIFPQILHHPQLDSQLLDHLIRKKITRQEIDLLQRFPLLIGDLFWEARNYPKWKQAFKRLLELSFTAELTIAYFLRCALGTNEESFVREKITSNPQMQRLIEDAKLSSISYAKLAEYAKHWYWEVRRVVAEHPKTQQRVLENLLSSKGYYSEQIKIAVIQNSSSSPKLIQALLASTDDPLLILEALKRPDLSLTTYKSFLGHSNPEIRELALVSVALMTRQFQINFL